MTEHEIRKKIERYKLSDAHIFIKETAIKELESKLLPNDREARKQYIEGLPDTDDLQQN